MSEPEATGHLKSGTPEMERAIALSKKLLAVMEAADGETIPVLAVALYMFLAMVARVCAIPGTEEEWINSIAFGAIKVQRDLPVKAKPN